MAALLLLLFGLQALIFSGNSQENNYDRLPETFRNGVDLALEKLHSHARIQHHFLFFKSVLQSDMEPGFDVKYIYHHFYLKATRCPRGTTNSTSCRFRNDRPLMDCIACYKTFREAVEPEPKPYIHCVHRTTLTPETRKTREKHCYELGYRSGSTILLASTGNK
ncbi:retinoic acid receptor responder protein 2-like [Brachionichthys hirsutus]|uniref:retinoic acid receptor responder protein 2-like n=1 Tax=Brachionichthys hirsutus TaxID=412623 RepID=UPI003604D7AD